VYRVSRLQTVMASLVCPRVMPMTCGSGKAAGQRVAQALICKQDVAGSSPAVSTTAGLCRKVACMRPDRADYEPITADELERLRCVERAARDVLAIETAGRGRDDERRRDRGAPGCLA
jgi:hypothetical protein